jgi:hypothetical protein
MLMRTRFEHRIGAAGASTVLELPTGQRIDTVEVNGTLNRLTWPRMEVLRAVRRGDREYAVQELWAFWLSWLRTLPAPVLNPPSPAGLSGAQMDGSDWDARAGRLGLPISAGGRAEHLLIVCSGSVVGRRRRARQSPPLASCPRPRVARCSASGSTTRGHLLVRPRIPTCGAAVQR